MVGERYQDVVTAAIKTSQPLIELQNEVAREELEQSAKTERNELFQKLVEADPTLAGLLTDKDPVMILHGRFSGFGQPANWIAADILRIKDGILIEHWDVIQDEASREQSKSGLPMFGEKFPK